MTVLSEALAGLSKTFSGEPKSAHTVFIESQLLPAVLKLQKEIGWRRYKECQAPLQEAVLALKAFQNEEWPAKKKNSDGQAKAVATAEQAAMRHSAQGKEVDVDDQETVETHETEETGTDITKEGTDDEDSNEAIAEDSKPAAAKAQQTEEKGSKEAPEKSQANVKSMYKTLPEESFHHAGNIPVEDDPLTREPVHPAIVATVEAFMMVLQDPAKYPRPCELALEGVSMIVANRYLSGRAGGQNGQSAIQASLLHRLLESVAKCAESNNEAVQIALISTMTTIMTSPKCSVHDNSMLTALRSTFHVYLVTKAVTCKASAKRALLDMLKAVFFRMEAHDAVSRSKSSPQDIQPTVSEDNDTSSSPTKPLPSFASQYHADAYYLFRSLCKLSSKELPADTTDEAAKSKHGRLLFNTLIPTDPTELNSKILALELILAAMEYSGEAFTSSKFLYLVQHYLCGSLLKNCVSNHTQVAFLSQKIFLVLVYKFKGHLKQDIEVFMSNVFFRVLESQNSSFKQKALVLESLRSLCKDPVLLTQIFLNYDCDFDAMNLYKDIVHMLTKLGGKATSAPSSGVSKRDAEQEFELSLAAIECLVTILKAFLRALGLPAGEDNDGSNDTAGSRIRGMLQLDSALAPPDDHSNRDTDADSVVTDDLNSISGFSPQSSVDSAGGLVGSDVAVKIVDAFDRKRNAEQNFEIGAVKFTLSLKTGLNFFIDNGFVELDAKKIALFFLANKDKLDKTQMGEALGREPDAAFVKEKGVEPDKGGSGFWVRILHHYAEALDFTGIMFDEAIRLFLSGFRLPGEAQKIDRIMEKFAERFTSQNPTIFPSSDTAFILAFSVIMLNTDLHNPSIKPEKRMTIESFLRNNKGIGDNGSDLPDDVLRGIFERIKERPFSLKEDDAARERVGAQKQIFDTSLFFEGTSSLFGTSAEERKRENFKKERDEMMAVTEQLIRRRPEKNNGGSSNNDSRFTEAISPADVVKPMFDVTWGPMIGILSQVLECADDERSVAVCLNGFVFAVRLAAHGRMSLARDTFVSSLAKFTFLGSIKEMKRKNVESIRTLLSVAVIDGEFLGESWGPVLQCMSQLARLRLSASGLDSDESFLMVESPKKASGIRQESAKGGLFRQHTPGEMAREAEESNGKAVLEAVQEVLIDKVFSSTVNLSARSLAHFVEQLIVVASSEIAGNSKSGITGVDASKAISENSKSGNGSSIFSLQRLVDVADYNMDVRPRLVWAQVWELMADFFVDLACHDNRMVSFFAIDSLKQLSLKFLEKPELSEFNFQCSFLKPFLIVMEDKGSREEIRELVLHCIDNIIRTKSHNLKSGWKVVFSILTLSAGDSSEKIEYLGLAILQRLLDEHLDDIGSLADKSVVETSPEELSSLGKRNRNANADDFVSLCRASLSFVQFEESNSLRPFGLTMRAFCHTAIYADLLAAQRVLPPVSGAQWSDPRAPGYTYGGMSEEESLGLVLWRPLFEGLADGVRSAAKTSSSGVGCLVQRGSILALRAILLRHGHLFSTPQLTAILRETILPAIQSAAEGDSSHVVAITSESPSISNIDFLASPSPLPPDHSDPELQKFGALNTIPKRPVGQAELMLEASFTDLRHGGDGDLRKAHVLAKKSASDDLKAIEQPFPDSWLATTAPIALGLLTDIASEFVVYREAVGREMLWPLIAEQYKLWSVGRHHSPRSAREDSEEIPKTMSWSPCEALVRISCRELYRLPRRMFDDVEFSDLAKSDQMIWISLILNLFSDLLAESVEIEDAARQGLIDLKEQASIGRKHLETDNSCLDDDLFDPRSIDTPFGRGRLASVRKDFHPDPAGGVGTELAVNIVELDFGATLYQPAQSSLSQVPSVNLLNVATRIPSEVNIPDAYWVHVVPALKIRCVAAHCLQQSLVAVLDNLVPLASKEDLAALLKDLNRSRLFASSAVGDEDISMAFQEALLKDWGDGIQTPDEDTETTSRLSLLHGSAVFFLAQEAGATKAVVHLLSALFFSSEEDETDWNRVAFSEPHLISIMTEVLVKFLASEDEDGYLIDPNVWRNASESGGKLALYCTSFAAVTVDILTIIRSIRPEQFEKYKHEFFPILCALVRVQSEEIRQIVQDILTLHVAPFLGVKVPQQPRRRSFKAK